MDRTSDAFGFISRRIPVAGWVLAILLLVVSPARAAEFRAEKYKLDNGLTVILLEDHALPIASTNVWYRVGARNEPPKRTGFAHLFEHLMFMGTRRAPEGQFDQIMEAGGGSNNADTSLDRTDYFASGPSNLLPTLLWLDADRLEDLGPTMTTEKLNKQRDVVRNEIRQNVENTPYGRSYEASYRLLFPPGHPYHNAVYGSHEDLEAATVNDVKDFFATFYVPNNLSLVVAGDFDAAKVKPLVQELFGSLPKGNVPDQIKPAPAKLDGVVRLTQLDKVQLPKLVFAYHSPAIYAEGDAEMDLASAILGDGKNGRLYKRLVLREKLAASVSAWQESAQFGSVFRLEVQAKPDADLSAVERIVDEEIGKLSASGPGEDELKQRVAQTELSVLNALQSLEARARILNQYENHFGDPNSLERDLDRYRKVTTMSLAEWCRTTLTPGARVIIRVLPEEPERAKSARDEMPKPSEEKPFDPAAPQSFRLANGVNVLLFQRESVPLVSAKVIFKVDQGVDPIGQAGLANLTASMLEEGTGDLDGPAFDAAMQSLGATFGAGAWSDSVAVTTTALARNFAPAMDLAAGALMHPRLAEADFGKVKSVELEDLHQQQEEASTVAAKVGARLVFGDRFPYAWPSEGTTETVEKVSFDQVKKRYGDIVRAANATVILAGNIDPASAKSILNKTIGAWDVAGDKPAMVPASVPNPAGLRIAVVDRPGAPQTVVRFTGPAPQYRDPARPRLRLVNTILGGSFTSRLNQNLREQHGYTYGAGSNFVLKPMAGYFVASAEVKTEVTGESIKELFAELRRLARGDVTPEELAKAQKTARTDDVQRFATLEGLLGVGSTIVETGTTWDTIRQDVDATAHLTADAANETARTYLTPDKGVLVLVGDKTAILKGLAELKDLKLPEPEEFDPKGNAVKTADAGK